MTKAKSGSSNEALVKQLKELSVRGVLMNMAYAGQLLELKCEMPTCYCPNGRTHFDPWPNPRHSSGHDWSPNADHYPTSSGHDWSPNADHYPTLKMDGGERKSWNVRLAHVRCNNLDIGWRKRIRAMLEMNRLAPLTPLLRP